MFICKYLESIRSLKDEQSSESISNLSYGFPNPKQQVMAFFHLSLLQRSISSCCRPRASHQHVAGHAVGLLKQQVCKIQPNVNQWG